MARILAVMVSISIVCMAQGLIVPLLALLLERRGLGAMQNSFSTTALFAGIILASPFIERMVRRFGAKRTILASLILCFLVILMFLPGYNFTAWTVLRFILGIGMTGVYIATEIWLNRLLTNRNRGRLLALYGFFIGIGMMVGPQGINLLHISNAAPFLFAAVALVIPVLITLRVSGEGSRPESIQNDETTGWKRWWRIFNIVPFAMCASLVFGYLDGALVGDFPIYGARIGLGNGGISLTLTLFMVGTLLLQFPLGLLSDRFGRHQTLLVAAIVGCISFLLLPLHGNSVWYVMILFFCIGGALGSFYSLGLAYLGDKMDGSDLATGNVLYTMLYGVGSLLGPSVTGFLIEHIGKEAFALSITGMLFCYIGFGIWQLRNINVKAVHFTHKSSSV